MNDALDAWEPLAVALLVDTAKRYNGFITYKQLAETVQDQSGVKHDGLIPNWIGSLLGRVISYCTKENVPQLSALCVKEDGTVGDGYRNVPFIHGELDAIGLDQLDDHAAKTRLACYRHFGAELPLGGGEPTLTPQSESLAGLQEGAGEAGRAAEGVPVVLHGPPSHRYMRQLPVVASLSNDRRFCEGDPNAA